MVTLYGQIVGQWKGMTLPTVGWSCWGLCGKLPLKTTDPAAKPFIVIHGPVQGWNGMEILTMCIGPFAPKMPKPPPPPPEPIEPPARDDPFVNAEASAKRKRALAAKGIGSTILSGPLGVTEDANTGKKSLLGS
jgi:hypothetical protein